MFKKASRFQQRLGTMIGSGMFTRDPLPLDDHGKRLSPYEQLMLKPKLRLARIRRTFELEAEIASRSSRGENVSSLREELARVKSGEMQVPLSLANDPKSSRDFVGITVARKTGPASVRVPTQDDRRRQRRPLLSVRMVEGALLDLSKSKLTTDGIAIAKVMLDQFEIATVSEALGISESFLKKLAESPVYGLAPRISPIDALIIVEVLEKRLAIEQKPDASSVVVEDEVVRMRQEANPPSPSEPAIHDAARQVLKHRAPGQDEQSSSLNHTNAEAAADAISAESLKLATLRERRTALKASLQQAMMAVRRIKGEIEKVESDIAAALRH